MRRISRSIQLAVAALLVASAALSLPATAVGASVPVFLLHATSTGGTQSQYFDQSDQPCRVTYNMQITVAYGKVTATTVYLKSVTYYYWVQSANGVVSGGQFGYAPYTVSSGTWSSSDSGTNYGHPEYGWHYTNYVNKTLPLSRSYGMLLDHYIHPIGCEIRVLEALVGAA